MCERWKEFLGECDPAPRRTLRCWERCWRAEFWSIWWRNSCGPAAHKGNLKDTQSGKRGWTRSFGHCWPIRVNPRRRARCWGSRVYLNCMQTSEVVLGRSSASRLHDVNISPSFNYAWPCVRLLTLRVHVGPCHPATAPLKTAVIFDPVDVPLHSSTRIYGTSNLGFQEFYCLSKAESFLLYYKVRAIAARAFYSRSLAPSQLAREEVYFICWVKVCLLHEGIIIPRSSWGFSPPQTKLIKRLSPLDEDVMSEWICLSDLVITYTPARCWNKGSIIINFWADRTNDLERYHLLECEGRSPRKLSVK